MQQTSPPAAGLFGWVARKPKQAFWVIAIAALVVGIGIGAAGGSDSASADKAKSDAAGLRKQLSDTHADLNEARAAATKLGGELDKANRRAATAQTAVKKLSAKAEVPDLTGNDVDSARANDTVSQLGWKIRTVRRVTTSADGGTVIAQSPKEGATLKAGRSVTLVVARKPPPKPKQWVTIKTLSGASSTKTEEFRVPSGAKARLSYAMPEDGNNAITLYKAPKEYIDLVLNEIGPQQGTTRLYEPGTFYLDVSGSYTIQVQVFKRPS
jgi:hypothetical protein